MQPSLVPSSTSLFWAIVVFLEDLKLPHSLSGPHTAPTQYLVSAHDSTLKLGSNINMVLLYERVFWGQCIAQFSP